MSNYKYKYKYTCQILDFAIGEKNPRYDNDDLYGDMIYYGMTSDPKQTFIISMHMCRKLLIPMSYKYCLDVLEEDFNINKDNFDGSTGIASSITVTVYSNIAYDEYTKINILNNNDLYNKDCDVNNNNIILILTKRVTLYDCI